MSTAQVAPTEARYVEQVMGLPVTLALRGRHARGDRAERAWAQALAVLRRADEVFSTYRAESAVSRLDAGTTTLADCPPEVHEVLDLAATAEADTEGWFRVRLPDPAGRLRLDPSGLVKGWALERAAEALADLDGTDWCLSGGGDMTCRTAAPESPGWRIGIEDPADPRRVLAVVPVRTGAVATSGTAHRGPHVLDPFTGRPPDGIASVTVVGPSLLWADVWATAAFARGVGATDWLRSRRGCTGLVVHTDGSTRATQASGAGRPTW